MASLACSGLAALALAGSAAGDATPARAASLPLAGRVVGIDPGHNGRNHDDPSYINHPIWNGREEEGCDTTGTETDGGYTEARFNFNVATYLSRDLRAEGARVVLTRTSDDGVGPCVNRRSEIINDAHANVAIDIHADGGPASGRGFTVLEPVADGPNDHVIGASRAFGAQLVKRFHTITGMPLSTYDGVHGISLRDNLAGLNLTTVPKVLIECGNMRNATDAALLVRPAFQRRAARAIAEAITGYLEGAKAARTFDVRSFGALGNATHNDTPAINLAIAAAARRGGTVEFPPGTYLAGGSIHLLSHVTLELQAGSRILGGRYGYDPLEPNPYAIYQDPGHSHFHDAVIWGENLTGVAFVGSGTIDGGGNLLTGEPESGRADKLIAIARCRDLTISGITIRRGGHFAIDINDCTDVRSKGLRILTSGDRDGWNVINSRDVRISGLIDHAYDDALVFKSEWALGQTLPSGDVTVTNAQLSSVCCNALMFGSETCGPFTGYRFSHITITGAGKSGLGMVSLDGGHISDVDYSDIAMSNTAGPIMEKIGIRRRCGGTPGIGAISDIHYQNITDTSRGEFSPTLWGEAGHPITDVSFQDVHMTFPGDRPPAPLTVPFDDPYLYNPDTIGRRPAYGFYLHHVSRISFRNSSFTVRAGEAEARPAFVLNDARDVELDHVSVAPSLGMPFQVVLQDASGFHVIDSRVAGAGPLRVSDSCGLSGPSFDCFELPPWYVPALAATD